MTKPGATSPLASNGAITARTISGSARQRSVRRPRRTAEYANMFVLALAFLLRAASARANTVQVPEGSGPVPVVPRGVVCGPAPVGWTIGAEKRFVRPPAPDEVGPRVAEVKVAADQAACSRSTNGVTLIATGQFPEIDLASVAFFPDEGRLEMKGQHLKGLQIRWQTPQKKRTRRMPRSPAFGKAGTMRGSSRPRFAW